MSYVKLGGHTKKVKREFKRERKKNKECGGIKRGRPTESKRFRFDFKKKREKVTGVLWRHHPEYLNKAFHLSFKDLARDRRSHHPLILTLSLQSWSA